LKGQKTLFSKESDNWLTPVDIYKEFDGWDDPCPLNGTDGLTRNWGERCFVNPPYSNVLGFVNKALEELENGNTKEVVFLVYARTDTIWFHKLYESKYFLKVIFLKGRLKFGFIEKDDKIISSAPAPSIFIFMKRCDL
jgi:hypothetical protein